MPDGRQCQRARKSCGLIPWDQRPWFKALIRIVIILIGLHLVAPMKAPPNLNLAFQDSRY
jgi:hypothetical protein